MQVGRLRPVSIPWQQQRWTLVEDALPAVGRPLRVLAVDKVAQPYPLPFDVVRAEGGGWRNAKHDRELEVRVTAWRYADV
jgi:hypothetical protein